MARISQICQPLPKASTSDGIGDHRPSFVQGSAVVGLEHEEGRSDVRDGRRKTESQIFISRFPLDLDGAAPNDWYAFGAATPRTSKWCSAFRRKHWTMSTCWPASRNFLPALLQLRPQFGGQSFRRSSFD